MIVVAIPNTNRRRDLTPTHVTSEKEDSTFFKPSGGGEKFTDFLAQDVIPYIEAHYPASGDRILIGHSLGGLMVIHTMMNRSDLFNKYIAIDPSLWWDGHKPLKTYEQALQQKKLTGKSLFIAVANTISMDTVQAMKDTTERTDHFRSIIRFARTLQQAKGHDLDWSCKYYREEGHSSVPLISEYDAFHFIFRKVPIKMNLAQLKLFEGKYRFQFTAGQDSFLEVRATDDNQLLMKELWTGQERIFKPLSATEFYAFDDHFPLKFIMDDHGAVKQILALNTDVWNKVEEPEIRSKK
jgi:predicted alpha/beta superfamily hydrolase